MSLPFIALLIASCQNGNPKQNSTIIAGQVAEEVNTETLSELPYTTVEAIDDELYQLLNDMYEYSWDWENLEGRRKLFSQRLELHLQNPLTFANKLPRIDSLMKILKTPDGKYKFYSFDDESGGSIRSYLTYIQYDEPNIGITAKLWNEDAYNDPATWSTGLYTDIWQFRHNETDYYVAQTYYRASIERYFCMDIFTISKGIPTYHTEFYPENASQQISYSRNPDNMISYTFDPETKTVSFVTFESNGLPKDEKKIEGSWRLVLD